MRYFVIIRFFSCFCLALQIYFVYLPTERDVDIENHPEYINVNKLKISRNALNLSLLRSALRKIVMPRGLAYVYTRVVIFNFKRDLGFCSFVFWGEGE